MMSTADNKEQGFYDWLDQWLGQLQSVELIHKIADHTYQGYSYSIRRIKNWMGDMPLHEVSDAEIQGAFNLMADVGVFKSAIHNVKVALNQAFNKALKERVVNINPVQFVYIPRNAKEKEIEPLTIEEQERLERECIEDMHGDLFLFLLHTGLRRAEMCNLKWKDYDNRAGILFIRQSKTAAGIRMIPLLDMCKQIIKLQPKRGEYIFSQMNQEPITPMLLRRTYERLRIKAQIPSLTNHVCRHTFATRLIERGADPKAVATLLGHTSVTFTLNRYVKAQPDFLRAQIGLLEGSVGSSLLTLSANK